MNIQEYDKMMFYNPGIVKSQLPFNVYDRTKKELEQTVNITKGNSNIIEKQYTHMISPLFYSFLNEMAGEYFNRFGFLKNVTDQSQLRTSQVSKINFQRKYEFASSDVDKKEALSWILWVQIPYYAEDEMRMSQIIENNTNYTSKLEFIYTKINSEISSHSISIDKSLEGTLMMFPSYLKHVIYPFYSSDDYRVFLTGSIWAVNLKDNKYITGKQQDSW